MKNARCFICLFFLIYRVEGNFGALPNQNNMRGNVPISTASGNNPPNMDVRMSTPLDARFSGGNFSMPPMSPHTPSGQTPLGPSKCSQRELYTLL